MGRTYVSDQGGNALAIRQQSPSDPFSEDLARLRRVRKRLEYRVADCSLLPAVHLDDPIEQRSRLRNQVSLNLSKVAQGMYQLCVVIRIELMDEMLCDGVGKTTRRSSFWIERELQHRH